MAEIIVNESVVIKIGAGRNFLGGWINLERKKPSGKTVMVGALLKRPQIKALIRELRILSNQLKEQEKNIV